MKRFTIRRDDGSFYVTDDDCGYTDDYESEYEGSAIDRLAHYEDLEEQGRLVVLPYQPGQVVWVVRSQTSNGKNLYLREERIARYVISECDVAMCFESGRVSVSKWHWETSVFLTREEAEAALKG